MAVDSRPTLTTSAASSGSVVWTVMAILVAIPVALPLLVVVAANPAVVRLTVSPFLPLTE